MLCETVFSNANLKPSELQVRFNNRHGGSMLWAMMKNLFELKEVVLILEQPFQN